MNIALTSTEQSSGELAKDKLANAIEAIRKDGYVIIEQVVDHAILDALKTRFEYLFEMACRKIKKNPMRGV